jgi:hypothetical protein
MGADEAEEMADVANNRFSKGSLSENIVFS